MKKSEIMTTMGRTFNKVGFKLKKHSPEILVAAGVVGTVASAVMACKATTKISAILDNTKETVESIHEVAKNPEHEEKYSEEDKKRDLTIVYVQTGLKLAKLYAPSVILGVASIGSILASNNILRKRNMALAAAYTAIDTSFKEYRNRVAERFGNDVEREIRYNIKAKEIEKTVVDDEGNESTETQTVNVVDPTVTSPYACLFDSKSLAWERDSDYNLMFLRAQQNLANDKLKADGYLFLNDVLDLLDIPRTKAGQIVGWLYDSKHPIGDNFVDFGIQPVCRANEEDDYEEVFLLDFNVDGNILENF